MLHLLQPHAGVRNARLQEPLMWRWGLVVGILALALIGCSSATQERILAEATITPFGVLFPKQVPIPDPQTYPTALLEGKLVVIERCLRVSATEGGTSYLLVWPPDFSLSADRGALIVLNRAGQMLYRQGDTVSIGGGEVPSDEASWLNIPLLRQKPPRECPGPYWLVSPLMQPTPSASDRSVTIVPSLSPTPLVTWTPISSPISATHVTSPTPKPNITPREKYSTYVNDLFGYRLTLPAEATVTEVGVEGYPSNEVPAGMTSEEYGNQLQAKYPGKLCAQIRYRLGYILISAPPNLYSRYAPCATTGIGDYAVITRTETITIEGRSYTAVGWEVKGPNETLTYHYEFFHVTLTDGTEIEYGSWPEENAAYADYLRMKKALLQIVTSYTKIK